MTPIPLPERTTVLAIGIETYGDLGDDWTLRGAAGQAVKFAQWAVARRIPEERIHLGCKWAPDEKKSEEQQSEKKKSEARQAFDALIENGAHTAGTTAETLLKTIDYLIKEGGDLLLVYWCGHGATRESINRCLFTSAASKTNYAGIRVEDLRVRLAGSRSHPSGFGAMDVLPSFARQAFFIDACAIRLDGAPQLADTPWSECVPHEGATQEILFSTQIGRAARFAADDTQTTFSSAVLTWLGVHADEGFPPDFRRLADDVSAELEGLVDGYGQPIRFYLRGRNGDEDAWQTSRAGAALDPSQVTMLVAAVRETGADFPSLKPLRPEDLRAQLGAGGERLLNELRAQASNDQEELAVASLRDQVQRQRWISAPLQVVDGVDLNSLRVAYRFARYSATDSFVVRDAVSALFRAAELSCPGDGGAPLYRMLAYLHHSLGVAVLPWLSSELGDTGTAQLMRECKLHQPTTRTRIFFDLRWILVDLDKAGTEDVDLDKAGTGDAAVTGISGGHQHTGAGDGSRVGVSVYTWRGVTNSTDGAWSDRDDLDWDPREGSLRSLVEKAIGSRLQDGRLESELSTVDFMLRCDQLPSHPELWKIDPWGMEGLIAIADKYPVAFHFGDRITRRMTGPWLTRLRKIRELAERAPEVEWLGPGKDLTPVDETTASCIAFSLAPHQAASPAKDPFKTALIAGAPYLVWSDDEPSDPEPSTVTKLVMAGIEDLPERLHYSREQIRRTGFVPRVIWDDETRIPPALL